MINEKDLEQLNRDELLSMLLTISQRCDILEHQLSEAKKLMQDTKEISAYAGPAADLMEATRKKCAEMEAEAKARCNQMIERAQAESQSYWDEVYSRIRRYSKATESLKDIVADLVPNANKK